MLEFTAYYKKPDGSLWLATVKASNAAQAEQTAKSITPPDHTYSHTGGAY
jgi:hypothetical protein